MIVYLNGKYIPEARAKLSIHDHGFLYGDGVYETLRVYNGRAFLLKEHLKRLAHSASWVGMKFPTSLKAIGRAIEETARRNRYTEAVVRLTLTRGPGLYGFDPALCKEGPTLAIVARPFNPYPAELHKNGITVAVIPTRRNNPRCLPPHVKSTSCMNGILAKRESLKAGAFEGVFLTLDDHVAEGTISNIFFVKNKQLYTPELDGALLSGVTRGFVIRLAKKAGLRVHEGKVPGTFFMKADEIFLTNTTMEIMPIRRVKFWNTRLGRYATREFSSVGSITRDLMLRFKVGMPRTFKD